MSTTLGVLRGFNRPYNTHVGGPRISLSHYAQLLKQYMVIPLCPAVEAIVQDEEKTFIQWENQLEEIEV